MAGHDRGIRQTIDWKLVATYLVIVLVGWVSIYAAGHSTSGDNIFAPGSRCAKQLMWICISIGLAIIIMFVIKPRLWSVLSSPAYLVVICLLLAVLVFGKEVNGSKSWFALGPISFQPAEISKITTSLVLADVISRQSFKIGRVRDLLIAAAILGVPMACIILGNETGTILVYLGFLFVLYREGLSGWWLAVVAAVIILFILTLMTPMWVAFTVLGAMLAVYYIAVRVTSATSFLARRQLRFVTLIAAIAGSVIIFSTDFAFEHILKDHQRRRIEVLLGMKEDPMGVGYNVNQSMIAIGSGGFGGKGFLQGTQTAYGFVPEQSTDFIFCTIGEEAGFLGCLGVILLFVYLIYRILKDAEESREPFTRVYGYCVASCFFMHLVINVGMTIGLMPVIGIPLPMISYGGSSLCAFTVLLFIFVALNKEEKKYF